MKQLERYTTGGWWERCGEDDLHSKFYENTLKYMESIGTTFLTISNVKYRIVDVPREWWIIVWDVPSVPSTGKVYDTHAAALHAVSNWWPNAKVIHVKEVE